jgi:hypothetical protein
MVVGLAAAPNGSCATGVGQERAGVRTKNKTLISVCIPGLYAAVASHRQNLSRPTGGFSTKDFFDAQNH